MRRAFEQVRCQGLKALVAQHPVTFFEHVLPQWQDPLYFVQALTEHLPVVHGLVQGLRYAQDRPRPFLKRGRAVFGVLSDFPEHFALTLGYAPSLNSPALPVGPPDRA